MQTIPPLPQIHLAIAEKNLRIPINDRLHLEMVYVEGGTFEMGYKVGRDGEVINVNNAKPIYVATLDSFYIGKFIITQEQYQAVMGKDSDSSWKGDKLPTDMISWEGALEFIQQLNEKTGITFRLPTEAEWEYAARGGNTPSQQGRGQGGGAYMYSGSNSIDEVAWYGENSGNKTHEVGLKMPNQLGIYDLTGNVWEWCGDCYEPDFYEKIGKLMNPIDKNKIERYVLRGGAYDCSAENCHIALREYFYIDWYACYGFRVCI
ncbi:MAG: formylglycine-generating enzyme family protein [Thermoflexibacter sp.]|jgi:formylglycine-generating enzyme required for sulfatase activity|nr:formylglycine-generating enzyme family protein [Thermoflexibacter sp.]